MPDLVGQAADFGLGMITNAADRIFQIGQQRKLTAMQVKAMKEMGQYNYEKQLQLWRETNYPAQVGMMKEAGLNPALMYKGAGAGGTTAFAGGGGVTGGTAGMELGNAVMQRAQIRLMEAQANKLDAETQKTAGVDTQLAQTQIADLTQGIENKKAQEELTKIQSDIAEVENHIQGMTQNAMISKIQTELRYATAQMHMMERNNLIDEATMDEKIRTIELEMVGVALRNTLTKSQTHLTNTQEKLTSAQIHETARRIVNMVQENMRQWDHLNLEQLRYQIQKDEQFNKEMMPPGIDNIISGVVGGVLGGKMGQGAGTTPIKGFHKR